MAPRKPRTLIPGTTGGTGMESLVTKARRQKQSVAKLQSKLTRDYGAALGGVASQALGPARARVGAGLQAAQSRVGQAAAISAAAVQSSQTYQEQQRQLQIANEAQMARTRESAKPQLISAQSAIKEAEAYAKSIGLDMKKMDWTAKASIYQSIIDQNAELFRMQFAQQLELDMAQKQADLIKEAEQDRILEGAPQVNRIITSSMPSIVAALKEYNPETDTPGTFALQQAQAYTNDETARTVLVPILEELARGAASHPNMDPEWIKNTVTGQIHALYPQYSTSSLASSLTPAVFAAAQPSGNSGILGFIGDAAGVVTDLPQFTPIGFAAKKIAGLFGD